MRKDLRPYSANRSCLQHHFAGVDAAIVKEAAFTIGMQVAVFVVEREKGQSQNLPSHPNLRCLKILVEKKLIGMWVSLASAHQMRAGQKFVATAKAATIVSAVEEV